MHAQSLNDGLKNLFENQQNLSSQQAKNLIKTHQISETDFKNFLQNHAKNLNNDKTAAQNITNEAKTSSKKGGKIKLKTKTWLENEAGELVFGKGKTELLELIDKSGSLLKAAKLMGLNYKKAWVHLQQIQNSIEDKLVLSKQGRSKDSGSRLSLRAKELLVKYQILQNDIENFANLRFKQLFENA